MDLMRVDFASQAARLDKGKTYLVYCRSGNRSAQACQILSSKGFKAFNLAGGIMNWSEKLV
jgi:rhodanese-related sulfurtransferase